MALSIALADCILLSVEQSRNDQVRYEAHICVQLYNIYENLSVQQGNFEFRNIAAILQIFLRYGIILLHVVQLDLMVQPMTSASCTTNGHQ